MRVTAASARAPRLIRNARMSALHETFLVAAVATVLVIRTQLWLTNYPQLGGAGLHIAHLLWGGLFMALAIGLLLTYVGPGVRPVAALLGGVGFGFFIDELGKFITADNNYFFRPAAALIYLVFVGAFLLSRTVEQRRDLTASERVANALDVLTDAAVHRMDERERRRALALLDGTDDEPLAAPLRAALAASAATPDRRPGRAARALARIERGTQLVVRRPAFPLALAAVFVAWAALTVVTVIVLVLNLGGVGVGGAAPGFISDRVGDLRFVNVASVVSSLASAMLVGAGVARLRAGDHSGAFRRFEQALLVSIFVTQTFSFVESQFGAVFGLAVALVLFVLVRRLIAAEEYTVAPAPAFAPPAPARRPERVAARAAAASGPELYPRGSPEFTRVCSFSDGIFAIAMTLLVAGIDVPNVPKDQLDRALLDDWDAIGSFAVSFAVIGYYWLAHHEFFRRLSHVDAWLVRVNLAYLGLIAFLPFPTALVGRYDGDPVAVALYAVALAGASAVEALMLRHARAAGALAREMSDSVFREFMTASLVPVVVFVASVPLAFAHPAASIVAWLSIFAIERVLAQHRSAEAVAWARGR